MSLRLQLFDGPAQAVGSRCRYRRLTPRRSLGTGTCHLVVFGVCYRCELRFLRQLIVIARSVPTTEALKKLTWGASQRYAEAFTTPHLLGPVD